MDGLERAMAVISPHCDIVERLEAIPPSARLRGLWFKIIRDQLKANDKWEAYEAYFPNERYFSIRFYWTGDFLPRLALAGALIRSPEELHDGMFEIGRANAVAIAKTAIGKALLRLLSRDPIKLREQGAAVRRQTVSGGGWRAKFPNSRSMEMHATDEFCWIESYLRGAAHGSYESIGLEPTTSVELIDPYNGIIRAHW